MSCFWATSFRSSIRIWLEYEPAYHHIDLRPQTDIENLSKVDCSYSTPYGEVVSKWHKNLQKMHWQVTVPCNTTATIHLPDGRTEEVGSGTHTFDISLPKINEAVTCSEFLYEKAPFKECHAATVAETPKGDLVATFFGGTKERNPDVCIWVCRKPKGSDKWTEPQLVADGKCFYAHVYLPTLIDDCEDWEEEEIIISE